MIKIKTKYILTLFVALITVGSTVMAQTDSLAHYLQVAAENNPGLKADFISYKASLERIQQAGALDDLQLDMGFFIQPMDIIDGSQVADFTVMQMFPWFGARKAAKKGASHQSDIMFEQFRESRDNLFLEVYTQWYVLTSLQQKLNNIDEHHKYLSQLEDLAIIKYSSSSPEASSTNNMSSTLRIRLESVELDNSRETVLSEIASEKAKFNSLLNRPSDNEVHIPDTIIQNPYVLNIASAMNEVSANSPLLAAVNAESKSFASKAMADRKMSMPMIGVGLQYSLIKKRMPGPIPVSDMNGMDMVMPMVSLTIPIYRNKYKAQQRESKLMREANAYRYDQAYNEIKSEMIGINHQLDDASRAILLLEKQIDLANTTYSLVIQEYATGKSDLADAIQVQRQLLDYKLRKSEAVALYNTLVASAQRLISFNDNTNYNK